jgi:hypothetical protein
MDVINPALRSADMQSATVEVNLIPPQAADFRGTQPVPVRNQDHGSVAMAIAGSPAGSLLQPLEPHPERSRAIFITAALRGILLAQSPYMFKAAVAADSAPDGALGGQGL